MATVVPDYAFELDQIVFHTETEALSLDRLCLELGRGTQREEPCDVWFQVRFLDGKPLSGWFAAEELNEVRELVRQMQLRVRGENGPTGIATDVKAWVDEIVAAAVRAALRNPVSA